MTLTRNVSANASGPGRHRHCAPGVAGYDTHPAGDEPAPQCVLPGCATPVELDEQWGEVCDVCLSEVGGFLQPSSAPGLTRHDIAERDAGVRHAYAVHHQIRETGFFATDSDMSIVGEAL